MNVSNEIIRSVNCAIVALEYKRTPIADSPRAKEDIITTNHLNVKVPIVATVSNIEIGFC